MLYINRLTAILRNSYRTFSLYCFTL